MSGRAKSFSKFPFQVEGNPMDRHVNNKKGGTIPGMVVKASAIEDSARLSPRSEAPHTWLNSRRVPLPQTTTTTARIMAIWATVV